MASNTACRLKEKPNARESIEATRGSGFGPEVKRRILIGTYALSAGYYDAYYKKAQQVRTLIRREFHDAFQKFDVIATPTSPTVAFELGEKTQDPFQMYLSDVCTIPVNIAGLPGISLPLRTIRGLASWVADPRTPVGRPHGVPGRTRLRAIGKLEPDTTRAMYRLTDLKPPLVKIIAAMSLIALADCICLHIGFAGSHTYHRVRTRASAHKICSALTSSNNQKSEIHR